MNKRMMKKIAICLLLMVGIMLIAPNVYAVDYECAALDGVAIDEKIINIVHVIILAIQIFVPIVLVIFGMLDLAKAVMAQKEDEIKKGQQTFIKRVIAAIIVFFVVTVVKMILSFLADGTGEGTIYQCVNCFVEGTSSASCTAAGADGQTATN